MSMKQSILPVIQRLGWLTYPTPLKPFGRHLLLVLRANHTLFWLWGGTVPAGGNLILYVFSGAVVCIFMLAHVSLHMLEELGGKRMATAIVPGSVTQPGHGPSACCVAMTYIHPHCHGYVSRFCSSWPHWEEKERFFGARLCASVLEALLSTCFLLCK